MTMAAETPPKPQCDHHGVLILKGGPHGTCPRCLKHLTAEEYAAATRGFVYETEQARRAARAAERLGFSTPGQDVTDAGIEEARTFFLRQELPEVAEAVEDQCRKLGWRLIRRGDPKSNECQYEVRRPDASIVLVGYWSFRDDERDMVKETFLALLPALMLHPTFRAGFDARGADAMGVIDDLKRSNKTPRRRFNPIHAALADDGGPARRWTDLTDDERAFVRTEWPELDDERLSTLAWVCVKPETEAMS